jgi:hypothetical protein
VLGINLITKSNRGDIMFKTLLTTIILMVSFQNFASAETQDDQSLFIASVKVEEVSTPAGLDSEMLVLGDPAGAINEISIIIDGLLGIGKKIWPIIEAGRPVVTTNFVPAISIIPNVDGKNVVLNDMANWSIPKVKSFRVSFQNTFGMNVVAFTYTVLFQYGGTYKDLGKYVTTLKVIPSDIYTSWGFNFDATSELTGISNVGSTTAPVASGVIQVGYKVKGFLNEVGSAQSFYVDGNGNITQLN